MSLAKLVSTSMPEAMTSDEGTGSLDTFIRQTVGREPVFSLSRTGDSPTQWIQLLHTFDQNDLPGWSLLTPVKVQMLKCDKCAREFCSTINYRRHIRVHRRSLNFHKEPQKYKDILGAFWDKLDDDKAKEIMSFKDVNLEEVTGSSIVKSIATNLRKQNFFSFPQVYVKAGSALVDIIQGRSSRVSSKVLFSILDDASEGTFLCAGTTESLKKFVFDGEAGKIGLETKNLIASTSFLVEQKMVDAWLADKDAEALRCQKLLVEEEEAAQKRQAELLEKKRQRKIRQKEQRAREQSDCIKEDLYTVSDTFESVSSLENPSHQISATDPLTPDDTIITPLNPAPSSTYQEAADHSDSTVNEQQNINSSQRFTRWQVPKSQRNGHYNYQNGHHHNNNNNQNGSFLKWEQPHKHREQRVNNGGKIWTKKPKPENSIKSRVDNDASNQTAVNSCQLMIGSISVTVRKSAGQNQVNRPEPEFQDSVNTAVKTESVQNVSKRSDVKLWKARQADGSKSQIVEEDMASVTGVDQTLTTESSSQSEGARKLMPFSVDAAKDFLAQRWKEAVSGEHVELVLTSAPEPPEVQDNHQSSESSKGQTEGLDSSIHANVQPKFRSKPKSVKTRYIPKQKPVY